MFHSKMSAPAMAPVLLEASVATITALERLEMPCSEREHDLTFYDIPFQVCVH